MTDKTETETERTDQTPTRRPWHAPQFFMTDVASTDVQANGGVDGGPAGSQS